MSAHIRNRAQAIEILLVEDSPTDRMFALDALRGARLANIVHVVEDGDEAIQFLRRQGKYQTVSTPDLILLDLNLPIRDGHEVLADIKGDPQLRLIPVVILTTSESDEDVLKAYGLHANSYIQKPVDFDKFTSIARSLEAFWFEVVTLPKADAIKPVAPASAVVAAPAPPPTAIDPTRSWKVLVVEDSPTDAMLVKAALLDSQAIRFEVTVVDRLAAATKELSSGTYDAVLSDLDLPDSPATATVAQLSKVAGGAPIIVLTMLDDQALGSDLVKQGASDYYVKGQLSPNGLARTIRYAVERRGFETYMQHSQRMDSLGVLAGGVAHDFNNLLTFIQGRAQLMRHNPEMPANELQDAVSQIDEAANRAASLTRQLLAFSRRQRVSLVDLDLNTLVGDFTQIINRLLGTNVEMELRLTSSPLPVMGDTGMLEQVIMNLVVNARDAMPDGGRVTLTSQRIEGDTVGDSVSLGYARLVFSDNGPGIPSTVLEHIFEPFYTTKEVGSGTGLGLATVHGIIEQHGGTISVESVAGEGTSFVILLPLVAEPKAVVADTGEETASAPVTPGTVLLVDDDRGVLEVTKHLLEHQGYTVETAVSGEDAVARWPEIGDKVDILLTDMMMPGEILGGALGTRLQAEKPSLRVIYMSGDCANAAHQDVELVENVNLLPKPFSYKRLHDILQRGNAGA